MSCGVGRRLGLDLALLWLWCRPPATSHIRPLAWEPPYASGVALKKIKIKNPIPMPSLCRTDYSTYLIGFPSDLARKQIASMTTITLTVSFADIIFTKRKSKI